MKNRYTGRRILSVLLSLTLLLTSYWFLPEKKAAAVEKTLLLSQAKSMALANSATYQKIKSKLALKEVSYKQAVKSLKLKKKNMSTFRWTPLLSFKFPEKADLADESEYVYKPVQIQNEITGLKHDLTDEVYDVYEKTANQYVEAYSLQEAIAFLEERLESLEDTRKRNEARLVLGEANQQDVDSIEKSIQSIEQTLAQNMRTFEKAKEKLSDMIHLDVTTQYRFINPYIEANLPRTELETLVNHTLDMDQSYYEAKLDTQLAKLSLETNYSLMEKQYGQKMSYISTYVQQAKNGEKLDSSAFKKSYDEFLTAIDAPWQGKKRILFIQIPKEWFKGAISGVRYVEDEPYALYEAALEYQEKLSDQKLLKKELEKQVEDEYEALVTARNSYQNLVRQITEEQVALQKTSLLNSLGECSFEEYTEAQEQYQELQMDGLEALELYTSLLYSYDRLTCGGVTAYLQESGVQLEGTQGGISYVIEEEEATGARYYIRSLVEDNLFEFGIYVPEEFELEVTHYELWCGNTQIGERAELAKTIRHLTLTLTAPVERVFVRLYNNGEFVDDCEIDPEVYEGELSIVGGYQIQKKEEKRQIGSYRVQKRPETSLVEITLDFQEGEGVAFYALQNQEGKYILTEEPIAATESFSYLEFLSASLEGLTIACYDDGKGFLYKAWFSPSDYGIYVEGGEAE